MRHAIVSALLLAACAREHAPLVDAGVDASPPLDAGAITHDTPAEEAPPSTFVEARTAHLTTLDDEPGLAKNAVAIRAHFGGALPAAMELQAAPLASGKQVLLLSAAADDPKPIALLVDAAGEALWIKERPLGGITPPAKPFAIAPRPDNGAAVFLYDEPTKLVAARMWTADGAPFADVVLYELARCDAIAAAWWPGRGWIVVTSFPGGQRAQLVGESGTAQWAAEGIAVGDVWRAGAPATIVIDAATSSWILVQHATRSGADHVVASRYGLQGGRLGKSLDLGAVARVTRVSDRIAASIVRPGVMRIDVGGKATEARIDEI